MNAPESFEQALQFAFEAAKNHVDLVIELAGARAEAALFNESLELLLSKGVSGTPTVIVRYRLERALFLMRKAEKALEDFSKGIPLWESGAQFDDSDAEYRFVVNYLPVAFSYVVVRIEESSATPESTHKTLEDAKAAVEAFLYPEELELRALPLATREDSDAAGDIIITFRGQRTAVKSVVDQALDGLSKDTSLQHEMFARRARDLLDELPVQIGSDDERDALETYLAYDRF